MIQLVTGIKKKSARKPDTLESGRSPIVGKCHFNH
jgi:hypothetical protein